MKICGIQKLTLLDYPGKVAATVFTCGCNFRCPFCQNAGLVLPEFYAPQMDTMEIMDYLSNRKRVLDGVCITGGEPCLQKDIKTFIGAIKDLGLLVKLDTNGSFPEKLKELIDEKLIDYVAMDIKAGKEEYPKLIGVNKIPFENIEKSIEILQTGNIPFEFRTTVVKGLHTTDSMTQIGKLIEGAPLYFIQNYDESSEIIARIQGEIIEMNSFTDSELLDLQLAVLPYVPNAAIRGKE